jgi:hypothetical protein
MSETSDQRKYSARHVVVLEGQHTNQATAILWHPPDFFKHFHHFFTHASHPALDT